MRKKNFGSKNFCVKKFVLFVLWPFRLLDLSSVFTMCWTFRLLDLANFVPSVFCTKHPLYQVPFGPSVFCTMCLVPSVFGSSVFGPIVLEPIILALYCNIGNIFHLSTGQLPEAQERAKIKMSHSDFRSNLF